jgi:hypothetical protein
VAQALLSKGERGTFLSINFSWGMAVTMGVYWAGSISGTIIAYNTVHFACLLLRRESFSLLRNTRSKLMSILFPLVLI